MCLSVKPNNLIIDSLLHVIRPWLYYMCVICCYHGSLCIVVRSSSCYNFCLRWRKKLDLTLDISPPMILEVFFHQSEILASISSSLHFHDCSSWISRTCKWKLYSSSVCLFVKRSLENRGLAFKAISKCGSPLFRFKFCYVTPIISCIFKCKPWRLTVKSRWDFRRHLCCHH